MKQKLFSLILLMCFTGVMSQSNSFWQKSTFSNNTIKSNKQDLSQNQTFTLNLNLLKQALRNAPVRGEFSGQSNLVISFPNAEGKFERFEVMEASVMHPDLEAKYPDIKSYAGQGLDDPTARIRFSISTYGFQSMSLSALKPAVFIEQITNDGQGYAVYNREDRQRDVDAFECEVTAQANQIISGNATLRNADDSILRTYRLAVSATGEYTQYHGGTKAQALAAIVNTMTRVNGLFETDFNVTMQLIANTDDVIYTSTSSDPYGNTTSGYNSALQSTLTSVIGESNYDIGHLFANLQNNGNAGCIGCVCVNGQKGSGWTSATVPVGDFFDVDYVAHEMGHQFGANHTWTFNGNEGTNVQVEPGSGSTIMSYAGITGATDVQANVHPNFHAVSIEQVTNYVKSTSCQTNTNTGNAVPTVSAGANYTIPRGTPFILEGTASDANSGDVLSYSWEQMDENNASTTYPSTSATTGVAFRAYEPTSENYRYLPRLETIKTGATSWQWEAVPNVGRTLNFRLTVRDNVIGGGTNNSDDMVVTVNGTAGPFVVNSPNTNVTWNAGTTQTVTWNVAGTTGNGINAANVDIYLSTDGGDTYPITLALGATNDGSHDIVVPNNVGTQNRIMVRGSNNIFFDISNTNFSIEGQVVCNASVPTGLAASNISSSSATLSWDAVPGASYDLQYRQVGSGTWTTLDVNGVSQTLSGLSPLTQYEAQVRSECPDTSTSDFSAIINFTTPDVQLNYCTSASTNINDEYIGRVQLNTIDNSSGGQFYTDFTSISTTLTKDTQYTITVTPTWTGTVYPEGYSVWIDYNRDGDFNDPGEQVWTQAATTSTPVSGSFTVPSTAVENSTTMRVSMKYNGIPTECETFTYGEVEDYTVIIEGSTPDTTAPVITLNGATPVNLELGSSYTELGATAIDDVDGDISANIVIGGDSVDTNTVGTYIVTYNVSDAAGNSAAQVTRTVNVNPDTTAPVITLNGASTVNINVGGNYTESGATATDNVDGDISANIVIGGDTVNTNTAGTYIVTYNVSDAAGNAATQVTRTVNVAPDTTAPVITLIGSASITLELGDTYTEQGATATDDIDGDISANIVIGGDTVNTNIASTYIITYNVSDAAGNSAAQVTRTVTVNPDTTIPVINLIGSSTINLLVGDIYNELGATATDNVDGDISANIIIGGDSVNTNVAGTYLITYNVSDSSGNAATQVTRTVNVSEPSSGCSGGISTFPYTEGFENTLGGWSQSTADDIDWTINANGTPSSNTGPSSASQGSYYIYVEASSPNYPSKRAILNSPCFDLSGMTSPSFDFDYHMYGASDMGTIDLEASTDDGNTWTSIWNESGNKGNQWNSASVDLSAYAGGTVQLRFNRFVGSTWQADIAIDNINLSEPAVPTCSDGIQNGDETGVDCGGSFCAPCSNTDVILNQGYFETGWDNWIDGGSDVARVSSTNSYEGSYSIRIRDNSGTASAMTLSNIDVTPYSQVVIDFYFYVFSMENGEDFWVRFYDGSAWNTVATYVSGSGISNNTFYNATVTLTPAQYNFAVNSGFRFQCDASGNNDQIFIDQVTITGTNSGRGDVNQIVKIKTVSPDENIEGNLKLYPNPVKGNVLNVDLLETNKFTYSIKNMLGQVVAKGVSEGKVDVSELNAGMYFIEVNDGEDILTKKFIRQ
jgi:Metallo-peptidase family M12B Reprolysin-like/MAM domain, meprin/A5/mu/GEVED domain/Bacterial surface protein, Ig-like domain/Secretion system C-terminal sorting domain/Fibronectin type III domain